MIPLESQSGTNSCLMSPPHWKADLKAGQIGVRISPKETGWWQRWIPWCQGQKLMSTLESDTSQSTRSYQLCFVSTRMVNSNGSWTLQPSRPESSSTHEFSSDPSTPKSSPPSQVGGFFFYLHKQIQTTSHTRSIYLQNNNKHHQRVNYTNKISIDFPTLFIFLPIFKSSINR